MRVFKIALMLLFVTISFIGCAKQDVLLTVRSIEQAIYIREAKNGTAEDKFNLGYTYHKGTKTFEKNDEKAVQWYEQAAELGHTGAQYNLGTMYSAGKGVASDKAKAFYWFHQAALQGDAGAQFNVGTMYDNGKGVEENRALAIEWYTKAANQGDANAAFNLGHIYLKYEPIQKELGCQWYERAAVLSARMQHELAVLYLTGKLVERNQKKAIELVHKAALRGYGQSQVSLGLMYHKGLGVEKNESSAYAWLSLANESKNRIDKHEDYIPELLQSMTPEQIKEGERKLLEITQQIKQNAPL